MSERSFHIVECAQKKAASMMNVDKCTEYTIGMLADAAEHGRRFPQMQTVGQVRQYCEQRINNTSIDHIHRLCASKADLYEGSDLIRSWN
jgi:hypothetical protein